MARRFQQRTGGLFLAGSLIALLSFTRLPFAATEIAQAEQPAEGLSQHARQLAADVVSSEWKVRRQAFTDLVNGKYRDLSDAERLAAVLPVLQGAEPVAVAAQGNLIEALPRVLGSQAPEALPALLTFLADEKISPYLRGRVMFAAARIGPDDPTVLAALTKLAASNDERRRDLQFMAIEELEKIGKPPKAALPALHKILGSEHKHVQLAAFDAIGRIVLATTDDGEFGGKLQDKDLEIRAAAHAQLRLRFARRPLESRDRAAILDILENQSDIDLYAATKTLRITGPAGDPRMLRALIRHASDYTIPGVTQALDLLEPTDPAAVEIFVDSLRRTGKEPRGPATMAAVRSLKKYGKQAQPAAPVLVTIYDRLIAIPDHGFSETEVQEYLATMAAAAPNDAAVLSRVVDAIDPKNPLNQPPKPYHPVAPLALQVMATLGVPAEPKLHDTAVDHLVALLAKAETGGLAAKVLQNTESTLLARDADKFIPPLVKLLTAPRDVDEEKATAENSTANRALVALAAIKQMGPAAKEALPTVKMLADRELLSVDFRAHRVIENEITQAARKAVAAIEQP